MTSAKSENNKEGGGKRTPRTNPTPPQTTRKTLLSSCVRDQALEFIFSLFVLPRDPLVQPFCLPSLCQPPPDFVTRPAHDNMR